MEDKKIVQFNEKKTSRVKELKKAERKRKFGYAYKVALGVLVVAALLTAYLIYQKTKVYESYTVSSSVARIESEGTQTLAFKDNILSFGKDGAGAVDATGKLLWNQTFDMQNPLISICGEMAAFADYGGSTVYIQSAGGETGTVKTDMPIRKISVAEKGYVAAVLEDTDVTWIYIYDLNGTTIAYFRTTMEKSGYPVDIDISPSGELVCVSYYYVDCDDVKSSVAFFNFGDVGQNSIDNYVSGYNYTDTFVPLVRFLDDETAIAVSSGRLSVYAGAHKPLSVSDMFINDEIQSVYYDKDVIAIIYSNTSKGSKYRLEVYDIDGKVLSQKAFDFDYADLTFGNGNVILYGDKNLYIGSYEGETKYEGNYDEPIKLVLPTVVAYRYTIVTQNTIDTVEFK